MANFNKVILVGRLTRDPETRAFNNGGMVTKIGFAVSNRKKNGQTGQWEDEPMFIDCEAFNRGENGKLADVLRDYCRKGSQIMIEGKLHLDTWQDKTTNQNRTKHKIVIDAVQLLDPKPAGAGGMPPRTAGGNAPAHSGSGFSNDPGEGYDNAPQDHGGHEEPPAAGGSAAEIPF